MAGYVKQGLLYRNCLQWPPQPACFLSDPGHLVQHWADAVPLYAHGIFQRVVLAAVVAALPGEQTVQLVADLTVRVTSAPVGRR